jgi:hypothetical protein
MIAHIVSVTLWKNVDAKEYVCMICLHEGLE